MKHPGLKCLVGCNVMLLFLAGCNGGTSTDQSSRSSQSSQSAQAGGGYQFTKEQKDATEYTREVNKKVLGELDFADKTAFDDVDRGLIAPLTNNGDIPGVMAATKLNFMRDKEAPATVNPSLWRLAQLVNRGGLYRVTDSIYQVRGQDLVNLTIIETNGGIVLYDIEYAADTLAASIKLYEEHRGKRPLKGVIISHSHADHFGGYEGIFKAGLATKEDFSSGRIPLIAPLNFVEESVSENVMAGNIMARRAGYQYGNVLQPGDKGLITGALGLALANGASSLPIPNKLITKDDERVTIDGVTFQFYLTPHAEAPAEMVFYIPQWKAMSMAEELNHLQHNIYTLRGAQIRDARGWASYLGGALARWGDDVEVNFGPHTWPVWGNENVVKYLSEQRDLYQSLYNTTLRYANHGYGPDEIAESATLPKPVANAWNNRPYYGHTRNNLKSTYIRNLGWYSGNPVELSRYPDGERGKRYVEVMGGEGKTVDAALAAFKKGDYRFAADLLNNVTSYKSDNTEANLLLADTLEQLGYQEENALYRNWYLSGAQELRMGGNVPNALTTTSAEVIASLPPDLFMSYLSMMVDPRKAESIGKQTINLDLNGEGKFRIDFSNGVLNYVNGLQATTPNASLRISKLDLLGVASGTARFEDLVAGGKANLDGDGAAISKMAGVMDTGIKNDMNLVLPLQDANLIK